MELNGKKRKAAELEDWQFDQLPDEMFAEVLSRLPLTDRFRDVRVSKRWQNLMTFKNIYILDMTALPHKKHRSDGNRNSAFTEDILQAILPKIGAQLESIIFRASWWRLSIGHLDLITQYCPKLIRIDLGNCDFGLPLTSIPFLQRLNRLNRLQSIAISNDFSQRNEILPNWLNNTTTNFHLKSLKLTHFDFAQYWTIFHDTSTVRLPQLIKLSLVDCKIAYSSLHDICNNCPLIESLEIANCHITDSYKPISYLKNLIRLTLDTTYVPDVDIENICSNCTQLEEMRINQVNIYSPGRVIPCDLSSLKNLPRLRKLTVTNEQSFDDAKLLGIAANGKLESFETDSSNVTHVSIIKLISSCNELTNLRLDRTQLNSETVSRMGDSKSLRNVRLTNCSNVTIEGFLRLLKTRQRTDAVNRLTITTDIPISNKLLKHLQAVKVHLQLT